MAKKNRKKGKAAQKNTPLSNRDNRAKKAEREDSIEADTVMKSASTVSSLDWSSKSKHLIALGFLLLLGLVYFSPVIFQGQSIVGGDTVRWRSMAQSMIEHRDETGEEPLWAENMFGGMPGYMINYPVKVPQLDSLIRIVSPYIWPLAQFFVLVFGMYLLVFYLTKNQWASLFSSLAMGLTSYLPILLIAGHNSKYTTIAYAPWLILAFAHVLEKPNLLSALMLAAAGALNLRAGHPQISYNVVFILGVWWIGHMVSGFRKGDSAKGLKITLFLGVGAVLSLLMIAHPYMAQFEYKNFTTRSTSGGASGLAWDYAMAWSHTWGELGTLLVANLFGGGGGTYWGTKIFTEGPHYVGGIALALGIYALIRANGYRTIAIGIGTGFTLLFATGKFTESINRLFFDFFPFFSSFRVPENWLASSVIGITVLAGIGLGRLFSDIKSEQFDLKKFGIAFGIPLGLSLLLLVAGSSFMSFEKEGEMQMVAQQIARQNQVTPDNPQVIDAANRYVDQSVDDREELMSKDAQRTFIFLLIATLLLYFSTRQKVPLNLAGIGLCLLLVFDLNGVGKRYLNKDRMSKTSVEKSVQKLPSDDFILSKVNELGGSGHFRSASFNRALVENARPAYFYESISGYHGAKLGIYQDYLEKIVADPQTGMPNRKGLDLMGVRYYTANGILPGSRLAYQDQQGANLVYEMEDPMPRAYFVAMTETVSDKEEHINRLMSESLDIRRTAVTYKEIDGVESPIDSSSVASVELEEYGPNRIRWSVDTDKDRLFVASEVYYPAGWTAEVDGQSSEIFQVNHLLRGVKIPAGSKEVSMSFAPPSHSRSIWIAGITTLLTYLGIFILGVVPFLSSRKMRKDETEVLSGS